MKKLTLLIALVTALSAHAQQYCPEYDFETILVGGGASVMILGYLGPNLAVRIPPRIQGLPVTHIGEEAFADLHLTSVNLPDSIIYIGEEAFAGNHLTSFTIPRGVTRIARWAFAENLLTSITIPYGVIFIEEEAFLYNQLISIYIPGSVVYIGSGAFMENQLCSVTVPGHIDLWGDEFDPDVTVTSVLIH
ncbi:MAG: leucine-rich repeat domain-containing protein [Treponema sp.]|nr:leucine-rich repeat domain-containing protein [Treponema sp.]